MIIRLPDLFLLGQQLFLLAFAKLGKFFHSFPAIVQIRNQKSAPFCVKNAKCNFKKHICKFSFNTHVDKRIRYSIFHKKKRIRDAKNTCSPQALVTESCTAVQPFHYLALSIQKLRLVLQGSPRHAPNLIRGALKILHLGRHGVTHTLYLLLNVHGLLFQLIHALEGVQPLLGEPEPPTEAIV
jgi:hypothetical protein